MLQVLGFIVEVDVYVALHVVRVCDAWVMVIWIYENLEQTMSVENPVGVNFAQPVGGHCHIVQLCIRFPRNLVVVAHC